MIILLTRVCHLNMCLDQNGQTLLIKRFIGYGIILIALISFSFKTVSFDIPEGAVTAMKSGDTKELIKYLNKSIELDILGKDGIYSKSQAEIILQDFFDKHHPKSFSVLFQGGKDNSQYAIGKLFTANGNFRINFLIKGKIIHQLRVENDD